MQTVASWLTEHDPHTFPYEGVVQEYHRVGKHFVDKELLFALNEARAALPSDAVGSTPLVPFLDMALDKYDGRYDYLTYTGLALLPLPAAGENGDDVTAALHQRDRLVSLLVTDALRFERTAADGTAPFLPEMPADEHTVAKRCRLGLRVTNVMLDRIGVGGDLTMEDPVQAAWDRCDAVLEDESAAERIALRLSMLPVYVVHDEYLFIRVLQSFEATFALLVVQLGAAVKALDGDDPLTATLLLDAARIALHESAPLFSLLATMRVESFRIFREFTDGASAIQSENYKAMESLCRRPDADRLDSLAYRSVPAIRRRILDDPSPNLQDTYLAAVAEGRLTAPQECAVANAMARFAKVLGHWRTAHYHLARRMLGDVTGTGQTEGTPYLKKVAEIRIFDRLDPEVRP
jgi:tryptophan 2,3-dioxygenase